MIERMLSCTKPTVNNYINSGTPSFTVEGITNLTFINNNTYSASMYLSVQYNDSAQSLVTLSLSGLPSGLTIDTSWVSSGYPTFSTSLVIFDSTLAGATPGVYTVNLNATTASGITRSYPFRITVKAATPCTSAVTGKYNLCQTCSSSIYYTDSVYADGNVANKIWFNNFDNTGQKVFGLLTCSNGTITIPSQTIGSYTFSGSGSFGSMYISMGVIINGSSCSVVDEN